MGINAEYMGVTVTPPPGEEAPPAPPPKSRPENKGEATGENQRGKAIPELARFPPRNLSKA